MTTSTRLLLTTLAAASLIACGGGAPATNAPSGGAAAADSSPLGQQLARGGKVYDDQCSSCHGDKGQGDGSVPGVAGGNWLPEAPPAGAKSRTEKFVTAQDVFDFTKRAMPKGGVGSLKDEDLWAVTAWELSKTGVDLGGAPLDATKAKDLKLRK
jgi:cytochrome c